MKAATNNLILITYLMVVAIIGSIGNGIILFAYGNRWNSAKSTSVIFIIILACIDLWTCLIVVPTIAFVEYHEFHVPSSICRFYSFSKNLIIISSFIMAFIAFDRFLNIAVPHYRLLNPKRVKVLVSIFIGIGIGFGTITALAFSTHNTDFSNIPTLNESYFNKTLYNDTNNIEISNMIPSNDSEKHNSNDPLTELLRTNISGEYSSKDDSLNYKPECFADTTLISDTVREILKNVSNKGFYILIGIVTCFYTITFIIVLRRQTPRIRELKRSLHILNQFDSKSKTIVKVHGNMINLLNEPQASIVTASTFGQQITTDTHTHSLDSEVIDSPSKQSPVKYSENSIQEEYRILEFINNNDSDDDNLPSPRIKRKSINFERKLESNSNIFDNTNNNWKSSTKQQNISKKVLFRTDDHFETANKKRNQQLSVSSISIDDDFNANHNTFYKCPCPYINNRQLMIRFHFAWPSLKLTKWFHSYNKNDLSINQNQCHTSQIECEGSTTLTQPKLNHRVSVSNGEILRKKIHQYRLRQIRMAITFLIITASFIILYIPSVLTADRVIKCHMLIYYLFLFTHALNPIIYCFMNPNLREYVFSMFNCCVR